MASCFQDTIKIEKEFFFFQFKCSFVLLHLTYKLPLCEPKIEFQKVLGAKALSTDDREFVIESEKILLARASFLVWYGMVYFI